MATNDYYASMRPLMEQYRTSYRQMTDEEFLDTLNRSMGDKPYFGLGRAMYLSVLFEELTRRRWDTRLMRSTDGYYMKHPFRLINNVLYPLLPHHMITDQQNPVYERLYHTVSYDGKSLIFLQRLHDRHYYEIEFLFPFPGFRADYFNETLDFFSPEDDQLLQRHADVLHMYLNDIYQRSGGLVKRYLAGARTQERRKELIQDLITRRSSFFHSWFCSRKVQEQLAGQLEKFIISGRYQQVQISGLHYESVYRNALHRYGTITHIENGSARYVYDLPWHARFQNHPAFKNTLFKKLKGQHYRTQLPAMESYEVDFDSFVSEHPFQLPLFMASETGTVPKITQDLRAQLEGQRVAILERDEFKAYEKGLKIARVTGGHFVQEHYFPNTRRLYDSFEAEK